MQIGRSWGLRVGTASGPEFALRCREHAGLRVPDAADVPPPLAEPVLRDPDLAGQWLTWWRRLLDEESARLHRELREPSDAEWMPRTDPLDLVDHGPLLRLAVEVTDLPPVYAVPERRRPFRPPLPDGAVERAVADVARAHGVPSSSLSGSVGLVPGPVGWRAVVRPGYGLMVADPSGDEDDLQRFVRAVLESEVLGRL